MRNGALILNIADPVLATYFQTQHMLKALRVREPVNLAIALAVEASIRVAGGGGNVQAAHALHKQAVELAERAGNINALGMVYLGARVSRLSPVPHPRRHSGTAIARSSS